MLSVAEKYKVAAGPFVLNLPSLYGRTPYCGAMCPSDVVCTRCQPEVHFYAGLARLAITVEHAAEAAPKIVSMIQETRHKNRAPDSDLNLDPDPNAAERHARATRGIWGGICLRV